MEFRTLLLAGGYSAEARLKVEVYLPEALASSVAVA